MRNSLHIEASNATSNQTKLTNMKTYKLIQKNQFKFQIKSGSKVYENIIAAGGGWSQGCRIFDTVDQAVQNWIESIESFADSCGKEITITVSA